VKKKNFLHYENFLPSLWNFSCFPAGFRPPPMAGKIRDIRAVEPIWCACGALAKGTVSQRLQDAKGLFSCVCSVAPFGRLARQVFFFPAGQLRSMGEFWVFLFCSLEIIVYQLTKFR
jgi:hypothetical protein